MQKQTGFVATSKQDGRALESRDAMQHTNGCSRDGEQGGLVQTKKTQKEKDELVIQMGHNGKRNLGMKKYKCTDCTRQKASMHGTNRKAPRQVSL